MPSLTDTKEDLGGFTLRMNTAGVLRAMRRFPDELEVELADKLDQIKKKQFKELKLKTGINLGNLRRGLFGRLQGYVNTGQGLDKLSLRMVSYSKAVGIHEAGGTIEAKPGQKLSIPVAHSLTPKGNLRKAFRLKNLPALEGDVYAVGDNVFWRRTPKSKTHLIRVLRRRVHIKARLNFIKTWEGLSGYVDDRLDEAAEKAIKKGRRK